MGRNSTTWDSGSSWRSGKTKTVRIPILLESQVMNYARQVDAEILNSDIPQRAGDTSLILQAIDAYIEYKRTKHHPNQHSRELDINTRAWDELRKFRQMLQENPQALGLGTGD